MPEPELIDLDAAFHDLATQIDAQTRARGPRAAIQTARRRRGAGSGALAAALLVAGGVLVATFCSTATTTLPPPVAPVPSSTVGSAREVPTPAPLTAARLDEAGAGRVTGWAKGPSPVLTDSPCISEQATVPDPVDEATTEYTAGVTVGASHSRLRFSSAADAGGALRALVAGGRDCDRGTETYDIDFSTDLEVAAYGFHDSERMGTVWLVVDGDRLDMLTVAGPRAAADDTVDRVAAALAADVLTLR